MTKKQLHTIILQEEEIARLTKRNRELESGHKDLWRENKKLRAKLRRRTKNENELKKVNV